MAAESSRCLYAGYRFESPLAGFEAGTTTTPAAEYRQTGPNFAGLHYTLHRHYDPVQMRFTGPDPAASPFHNLHAYCGNNPNAFFDPDGLSKASEWLGNEMRTWGQDEIDEMRANGQETGAGVNEGIRNFFSGLADVGSAVILGGYDFTNWLQTGEEMALTKIASGLNQRWVARADTLNKSDGSRLEKSAAFVVLGLGDLTGSTPIFVEAGEGVNSVTGERMTEEQRAASGTEGVFTVFMWSRGARPKGGNPAGTRGLTADQMIGRRGGEVVSRSYLRKLKAYLDKRGVNLQVGGNKGGYLRVPEVGKPTLRLPRRPTTYEVWHELGHYIQYRQMGRAGYRAQVRPRAPEQFTFNLLRNGRHWDRLNPMERMHAERYIKKSGGYAEPLK